MTDVVQKREEWREFQKNTLGERIIFIDESAAKTNMIRLYGRSIRGERCFDKTPHKWKTITMLSLFVQMGIQNPLFLKEKPVTTGKAGGLPKGNQIPPAKRVVWICEPLKAVVVKQNY